MTAWEKKRVGIQDYALFTKLITPEGIRSIDFHSCTDPSLYPLRLEIRHRLLTARRVALIEDRRSRFARRDRPVPRASRRCLWVEKYPSDLPVAVANIVIVIGPFAAWAGFGGAVEGEGGHFLGWSWRSAKFRGLGSSPSTGGGKSVPPRDFRQMPTATQIARRISSPMVILTTTVAPVAA
jgi:hypothetical protein